MIAAGTYILSAVHSLWAVFPVQVVESSQTLGDFIEAGGLMMIPIGLCSVIVVAFALDRYASLTQRKVCPKAIVEAVVAVEDGNFSAAAEMVADHKSPAARILAAGIRRRGFLIRDVEVAMEDQALKEVERLRKNVRPLALIGSIAPLMGLLGTVLGIADSFRVVAAAGMGKPELLAGGIEKALTTTIAGLIVAIPALIICAHLQSKVRRLIGYTDEIIAPVIEHLVPRPVEEESDAA